MNPVETSGDPADLPTVPYDLDDDLLDAVRADGRGRVRVRPWTRGPAVVMGRGGKQALEVDRAAVTAAGVPLYRRPGGGCAVVLDAGNLTAAVVLAQPGVGGITRAFDAISAWFIAGLAACGRPGVVQEGTSDLVLDGHKVGGSCIWRTRGLVYYATTLLVAPDLPLVERLLPHPPREPAYRRGRSHCEFMGRLNGGAVAEDLSQLAVKLEDTLTDSMTTLFL